MAGWAPWRRYLLPLAHAIVDRYLRRSPPIYAHCAAAWPRAGTNDPLKMAGVVTITDGPYLDYWSKVPPEIAAKYNTAPK